MKTEWRFFVVLAFAVSLTSAATERNVYVSNGLPDVLEAPRPLRDRFRLIQTNLTESKLQEEIDYFTSYRCEHMVVITNEASDLFPVWCSSHDDKIGKFTLRPGQSLAFTFGIKANGQSQYWCTLDFKKRWAAFDVFNEDEWYTCSRDNNLVSIYNVRDDGIYAQGKHKIRALLKGHSEYSLWESYDADKKETDDLLMSGYVDGGMCANVPHEMNDRASAVTVCEHQCIIVYEHYRCEGESRKLQSDESCIDFELENLDKTVSAVKGC